MDIVVKGRNVEVPEHFRTHVVDKLSRSERYDPKIIRVEVELSHETNRRRAKSCQRVQITLASRGPVVRAEASADSFYAALDGAVIRLETRLRRSAERRQDRQHARTPITEVAAPPEVWLSDTPPAPDGAAGSAAEKTAGDSAGDPDGRWQEDGLGDSAQDDGSPGRIVRIKSHPSAPITVDQALLQMELVGHDFYLFSDADSGVCSVVYRRKGFDYGLLRLDG